MEVLAIVAGMRKFVSLFISLTIVLISSIPLVPISSACDGSDTLSHAAAMLDSDPHIHHHPAIEVSTNNLAKAADKTCQIECGCGCHNSIDSLPHALAPHSPDNASKSCLLAFERVTPTVNLRPEARILTGFSPPPQFV